MNDIESRFWNRVDRSGGSDACWPWTGATNGNGYGRMKFNGISYGTHRLAYEFSGRGILGERLACHHCDNPPCCNPSHIYAGDHSTNGKDAHARGLHPNVNRKGGENGYAKLADSQIPEIRARIARRETNKSIAARFGVTHSMISRIKLGHSWTHI